MKYPVAIAFTNDRTKPHVVWVEPWGEDYTMLPKDECVVLAERIEASEKPCYWLVETEGNTQVYCEQLDYPKVTINGVQVQCGHNREAAIHAGVYPE